MRLNSNRVRQNVTFHCKNAHADSDTFGNKGAPFVKIMTSDELEVHTSSRLKNRLLVLQDECNKKDSRWHKAVFELDTKILDRLPIMDIGVYDVADRNEEFGIELGSLCFS